MSRHFLTSSDPRSDYREYTDLKPEDTPEAMTIGSSHTNAANIIPFEALQ